MLSSCDDEKEIKRKKGGGGKEMKIRNKKLSGSKIPLESNKIRMLLWPIRRIIPKSGAVPNLFITDRYLLPFPLSIRHS